jgi:ribose/xylose/arabinose/galactoside ABC-type transport system permease subunit
MNSTSSRPAGKGNVLISKSLTLLLKYGVYFCFLLMVVYFSTRNPRFFTVDNLLLILQQASPLGIVVVGMTLVLVLGGLDISVGRIMFLSGSVIGYMLTRTSLLPSELFERADGYLIVFGICVLVGAFIGLINGLLVARLRIVPFIATLAIGSIIRGIGLTISGSRTPATSLISGFVNGKLFGLPMTLVFFIVIALFFDFVLRRTVYGRHLMAIGNSPDMAHKTGINVGRSMILAYVISGSLAGLSGGLLAGQVGAITISFGEGNEFIAISAAVLGGTSLFGGKGSIIPGAIIGIILVTTIMNGLAMVNASPYVYTIVRGCIIFFAVMVDSIKYKGELR